MWSALALLGFVGVATAMYSPSDDVVILTPSNFNKLVKNSDDLWIVEFYAPWCGHCKALTPEFKKAATALKGVVKVGAVDADEHKSLGGEFGVRGFPTLKVFGDNKNKPEDYNGQRTAKGIADTMMSKLQSIVNNRLSGKSSGGGSRGSGGGGGGGKKEGNPADVVEITDSNFKTLVLASDDLWMVEFFAPWCGHCKTLAPHWASAATELKGKVKFGAVDATVHTVIAGRYGVQGFPTIKMFPSGKKDGDAVAYDAGRTSSDIVAWAVDKLAENIPAPELVQLSKAADLTDNCESRQLCVISILPHILDCQSECRNKFLAILKQMGEKYKKRMWGWVWAEAGAQPELEEAFGIGGFGYPAMAAANSRKMKYTLLRGSFSETGVNEFLRELAVGRGSTLPIKNATLPKIFDTEEWDGKDGQLPEEEDIDLSDVELDDLDEKVEL